MAAAARAPANFDEAAAIDESRGKRSRTDRQMPRKKCFQVRQKWKMIQSDKNGAGVVEQDLRQEVEGQVSVLIHPHGQTFERPPQSAFLHF
jgi:hypothetical protein